MERPVWGWALALSPVYVFLSSYLGLAGTFFFLGPGWAFDLMRGIWSASLLSDALFVVTTLAAGGIGVALASRRQPGLAVAVGALAHWLAYWTSFVSLPGGAEGQDPAPLEALLFVLRAGFVGLLFASLAPVVFVRAWQQRAERAHPSAA